MRPIDGETKIIEGAVPRVAHVSKCEHCDGAGWVLSAVPNETTVNCWHCDGKGENRDFDCSCTTCRVACRQLGEEIGPDVDGYECSDCGQQFSTVVRAMDHAFTKDHETYAVYAETGSALQ